MATQSEKGIALVTGASTGIGAVYADRLARRGYDLILVARDKARLSDLSRRIEAETGHAAEVLQADLMSRADLERVAKRLRDDKAITMLVNNAGLGGNGPLAGADLDRVDALIDLNVKAVTHLAVAAATNFEAQGRGAIINLASVLALLPERSSAVYSATKAYVLNLSQTMNVELAPKGVTVQAVLPGATRTEIWQRAGIDISGIPAEMIMDAGEMVDAALAGLDLGELVTIPALPEAGDWERFNSARLAMGPNLSRDHAAARYKAPTGQTAARA
jgi:uncharacterized protein